MYAYATVLESLKIALSLRGKPFFLFAAFFLTDIVQHSRTNRMGRPWSSPALPPDLLHRLVGHDFPRNWVSSVASNAKATSLLRIFPRHSPNPPIPQAMAQAGSPYATVYAFGYRELQSQVSPNSANPSSGGRLKSLQAVTVNMQLAAAEEVRRAEKGMSWLATTGSVSPFIGLFGTVWGIIDAFSGLGAAGSASLRAVAPGISEALFTTAAGLVTAIPAVIFYNQFLANIRNLAQRLDTFTLEVAAQIEKTFT